jgi:hypothetical protein
MIRAWADSMVPTRRVTPMHDIMIALAFIGMVIAPAVVAAKTGNAASKFE